MSIHILDDDSLLNTFYLFRPFFLYEGGAGYDKGYDPIQRGEDPRLPSHRSQGRWWYRLAHVCQRWRNLTLGSASYLGLSLLCTFGTPVANMLAHSPPLPLTVDYVTDFVTYITAEYEDGILLALQQRHRLRLLCLGFPGRYLRKFLMGLKAIDGEFPA